MAQPSPAQPFSCLHFFPTEPDSPGCGCTFSPGFWEERGCILINHHPERAPYPLAPPLPSRSNTWRGEGLRQLSLKSFHPASPNSCPSLEGGEIRAWALREKTQDKVGQRRSLCRSRLSSVGTLTWAEAFWGWAVGLERGPRDLCSTVRLGTTVSSARISQQGETESQPA